MQQVTARAGGNSGLQPGAWWRSPGSPGAAARLSVIPEGVEGLAAAAHDRAAREAPAASHPQQQQQPAACKQGAEAITISPCSSSAQLDASQTTTTSRAAPVEACAWALNIRHFTDCVPLESFPLDSLYTETLCSNAEVDDLDPSHTVDATVELLANQQQPHPAKAACELLRAYPSSSSLHTSQPSSSQQRVQQWLLSQGAAGSCPCSPTCSPMQHPHSQQQQPQQPGRLKGPDSTPGGASLQGPPTGASGDGSCQLEGASFDAPDWWQAAVLERWDRERQEFGRSWFKRACMWMQFTAAKTNPNLVN